MARKIGPDEMSRDLCGDIGVGSHCAKDAGGDACRDSGR